MAKRFFRNNGRQGTPARLAEDKALVARNKAYDDAREKAVRVLQALKCWPAYDATGNISGAIDHTLANIEALDAALDELHEQIDKFRGQKSVQLQVNIANAKGPAGIQESVNKMFDRLHQQGLLPERKQVDQ